MKPRETDHKKPWLGCGVDPATKRFWTRFHHRYITGSLLDYLRHLNYFARPGDRYIANSAWEISGRRRIYGDGRGHLSPPTWYALGLLS